MAGSLRGDDRVRLHSLQGAAQQHNRAAGHPRSWNAGTGRWDVKLSTGPELSVRPTNLTRLCSRPGCAIGETEARLKSCARCKVAAYCSKECQVAAWKGGHKKVCKPLSPEISEQLRGLAQQTERENRDFGKMRQLFRESQYEDLVKMAEGGLALAREVESLAPCRAALIYIMLGKSFSMCGEHVKGLGLMEQARALRAAEGDQGPWVDLDAVLCNSLGLCHQKEGEHDKAIEELEKVRAIAVDKGLRLSEAENCTGLALSFRALKQYDKAIELLEHSLAVREELGDRPEQAAVRINLGLCLSWHGQHGRAVACLKQAWGISEELGDVVEQARAAKDLGGALWAKAREELQLAAPDATHGGGRGYSTSAAGADALHDAETWLRAALDLAVEHGHGSFRMDTLIYLACVVFVKGDEEEALDLLWGYLRDWVEWLPGYCAGCFRVRGQDTPMLMCEGCRVARCVYVCCNRTRVLACQYITPRVPRVRRLPCGQVCMRCHGPAVR